MNQKLNIKETLVGCGRNNPSGEERECPLTWRQGALLSCEHLDRSLTSLSLGFLDCKRVEIRTPVSKGCWRHTFRTLCICSEHGRPSDFLLFFQCHFDCLPCSWSPGLGPAALYFLPLNPQPILPPGRECLSYDPGHWPLLVESLFQLCFLRFWICLFDIHSSRGQLSSPYYLILCILVTLASLIRKRLSFSGLANT